VRSRADFLPTQPLRLPWPLAPHAFSPLSACDDTWRRLAMHDFALAGGRAVMGTVLSAIDGLSAQQLRAGSIARDGPAASNEILRTCLGAREWLDGGGAKLGAACNYTAGRDFHFKPDTSPWDGVGLGAG